MRKTPDEIKKGLETCSADECHGQHTDCPYHPDLMCIRNICADALALIQQLQAENADLLADNGQLTIEVTLLQAKVQQLEAELKDTKANHQHTIDIAERQKDQIDKLKKVIVRLNAERDAAVEDLESYATVK